MSFLSTCLLLSIALMMALVYIVANFISTANAAKQEGYKVGLWHAWVNGVVRRNHYYRGWIREYNVYYWSVGVLLCLIVMTLGMLSSFSHSTVFNRPELVIVVSPIFWFCLAKCMQWYIKKTKELNAY